MQRYLIARSNAACRRIPGTKPRRLRHSRITHSPSAASAATEKPLRSGDRRKNRVRRTETLLAGNVKAVRRYFHRHSHAPKVFSDRCNPVGFLHPQFGRVANRKPFLAHAPSTASTGISSISAAVSLLLDHTAWILPDCTSGCRSARRRLARCSGPEYRAPDAHQKINQRCTRGIQSDACINTIRIRDNQGGDKKESGRRKVAGHQQFAAFSVGLPSTLITPLRMVTSAPNSRARARCDRACESTRAPSSCRRRTSPANRTQLFTCALATGRV